MKTLAIRSLLVSIAALPALQAVPAHANCDLGQECQLTKECPMNYKGVVVSTPYGDYSACVII